MATAVATLVHPLRADIKDAVLNALQHTEPLTIKFEREDPFGSESELAFRIRGVRQSANFLRVDGMTTDGTRRVVCITIPDDEDAPCIVDYTV